MFYLFGIWNQESKPNLADLPEHGINAQLFRNAQTFSVAV